MTLGTSTPLTPNQIRAALAKFGVQANYIPGWETRNRGDRGDGWGPVNGFVVHHTGDDAPDDLDLRVVRDGRSDLPGPLAQFGLRDNGVVDVIGCGRANHAGTGDSKILDLIRSEGYDFVLPAPQDDGYDGNGRFYGVEAYYSGSHRPEQYNAMVNLAAAICDAHGWTGKSVLGHREWTRTKIDPGSVDMPQFRRDVNARIAEVNRVQTAPSRGVTRPPLPSSSKPDIRVANLRPGYHNADVKAYNDLLWKAQGPVYKAMNLFRWMRESSWVYGTMTEKVTYDSYVYRHKVDPQHYGPAPSRPAWPGPQFLRFLGANPV